jgi:3-oxoacyl-[acyl-carrier protein] reductase
VTGGNRGIGLACAHALARAGRRVAVTYRDADPRAGLLAVRCDVTDDESVERAVEAVTAAHGGPEIVVVNAGVLSESVVNATSRSTWDTVIETNLTAAFRVVQAAVSGMLRAHWGRVVLVSSIVGFTGSAGQTAYSASKAALVGLARSLSWELGPHGITVNVVAPGLIDTRMTDDLDQERRAQLVSMTPLGRQGAPEEVAEAVRFLAGEEASYITGAVVPVSGGLGMGV